MVHPFLRRRDGPAKRWTLPERSHCVQVLEKTLGVPIFQEQAMRLAVVAAGFTPRRSGQVASGDGCLATHRE